MNNLKPIASKNHLKELSKKFYKIDYICFVYVDGNYIGWDYGTLSLFLSKDKGHHFLDASTENYLLNDFSYDTIHFVRRILK